jgi:polyisoprenoid-binding protein YceI
MGRIVRAALLLTILLVAPAAWAGEDVFTIDSARSTVTFFLGATGHDVEGTLAAPSGAIRFDPATGTASGEIRIDLHGSKTGNDKRDRTMHNDVLETEKFPLATLHPRQIKGTFAPSGTSEVTLEGTLKIHGLEHQVAIPAKATVTNGELAVEGEFEIPFVDWGMHDPSFFLFRVDKSVKVHIKAAGSVATAVASAP